MPSAVDICNLALSHLGDSATVASIDPPEGSVQAEHCARFWPFALGGLLDSHPWSFALQTAPLALLDGIDLGPWAYAYALPADCSRLLGVRSAGSADDEPFEVQAASGRPVVLCNVEDARGRYVARVTDAAAFPHLFTLALSYSLAAMLAGPILKGKSGAEMASALLQMALAYRDQARVQDANQGPEARTQTPVWISDR